MKILRDKTYRDLMRKVDRANFLFDALDRHQLYTEPLTLRGEVSIERCFFYSRTNCNLPAITIEK
jgi:hypothetical protein